MNLLKQNHVKYGLIMCLVLIACLLIMKLTGGSIEDKSPIFLVYQFLAPLVVWHFGIKARKEMQGGKLTFKEGVKEGFKISLVFGIISPFIFAFYYAFVDSTLVDYARMAYGLNDASDTVVTAVDMLVQFVSSLVFGTIYAAIVSAFLRTKN